MEKVYLLQHHHISADEFRDDEVKLIGVYEDYERAEEAADRCWGLEGFRDYDRERFFIDEYVLDEEHWGEGFVVNERIDIPEGRGFEKKSLKGPCSERFALERFKEGER